MPPQNVSPDHIHAEALARRFAASMNVPEPKGADIIALTQLLNESHEDRKKRIGTAQFQRWLGGEAPDAGFFPIFARILDIPEASILPGAPKDPAATDPPKPPDKPKASGAANPRKPPKTHSVSIETAATQPPRLKKKETGAREPPPAIATAASCAPNSAGSSSPDISVRQPTLSAPTSPHGFDAELHELRHAIGAHDAIAGPHAFWNIAEERGLFDRIPRTTIHALCCSRRSPSDAERNAFRACFPEVIFAAIHAPKPPVAKTNPEKERAKKFLLQAKAPTAPSPATKP